MGRVIQHATGEPVPQAEIAIEGVRSTLSDLNAGFVLTAPAGTVDITVQALGYASKTVTDVEVPAGDVSRSLSRRRAGPARKFMNFVDDA